MTVRIAIVAVLLAAAAAGHAAAQEVPLHDLCADRPGKGTPPCIIDKGHLELEMGVGVARNWTPGERDDSLALGGMEVRVGLARRFEMELGLTAYSAARVRIAGVGSTRSRGVGDLSIGGRYALTDPDKDGPAVSIQGFVTAPTATGHRGSGGWEGGVVLPLSLPLGGGFSLGASPEVQVLRTGGGGGTHQAWSGALSVSHAVGPISLSVEAWGGVDDAPSGATHRATIDLSGAWTPAKRPNMQFDLGVNFGVTRLATDVEISAGVVRRY